MALKLVIFLFGLSTVIFSQEKLETADSPEKFPRSSLNVHLGDKALGASFSYYFSKVIGPRLLWESYDHNRIELANRFVVRNKKSNALYFIISGDMASHGISQETPPRSNKWWNKYTYRINAGFGGSIRLNEKFSYWMETFVSFQEIGTIVPWHARGGFGFNIW